VGNVAHRSREGALTLRPALTLRDGATGRPPALTWHHINDIILHNVQQAAMALRCVGGFRGEGNVCSSSPIRLPRISKLPIATAINCRDFLTLNAMALVVCRSPVECLASWNCVGVARSLERPVVYPIHCRRHCWLVLRASGCCMRTRAFLVPVHDYSL
jgi:hypothetical protein